jgi:SAM-dependent methyltransferase
MMDDQSRDRLKEYYDRTSKRFWDPLKGPTGRDLIVLPLMERLSGSLLEYGFGSASLLFHLAQQERFDPVFGIEISEELVKKAKTVLEEAGAQWTSKVNLYPPVNDQMPDIPDESLDVIICAATIEHVLDPYVVLDELHRITKPGGKMVCSVPNYSYIKNSMRLLFGKLPGTGTDEHVTRWRSCGWDGMHLHVFTKSAFTALLIDCGWQPVKWTGWGNARSLAWPRRQCPGFLSGEIIALCNRM